LTNLRSQSRSKILLINSSIPRTGFKRLLRIPEFDDLTKSGEEKSIKLVVIMTGKFKPFY
jgi:hypothetical protein